MTTEYIRHFGMVETPFARNHDPKWFYLSPQYKEAVLKARWAVEENCGLSLIRGDFGQGKSYLIEYLMTQWTSQFQWNVAKLQNTTTIETPKMLLTEILAAFGLPPSDSTRDMTNRLETFLLKQSHDENQTVVLFIDEAQSIAGKAFAVLRDLLNLETRSKILLQIVMAASLKIDRKLEYYPALQSRIASVSTLAPLTAKDTDALLLHRFCVARAADPFRICSASAMSVIHYYTGGIPRDVLVVTEAALKEAFLQNSGNVQPSHVEKAVADLACRQPRAAKEKEKMLQKLTTVSAPSTPPLSVVSSLRPQSLLTALPVGLAKAA